MNSIMVSSSCSTELLGAAHARVLLGLMLARAAQAGADPSQQLTVEDSLIDDGFWIRRGSKSARVERRGSHVALVGATPELDQEVRAESSLAHARLQSTRLFEAVIGYLSESEDRTSGVFFVHPTATSAAWRRAQ